MNKQMSALLLDTVTVDNIDSPEEAFKKLRVPTRDKEIMSRKETVIATFKANMEKLDRLIDELPKIIMDTYGADHEMMNDTTTTSAFYKAKVAMIEVLKKNHDYYEKNAGANFVTPYLVSQRHMLVYLRAEFQQAIDNFACCDESTARKCLDMVEFLAFKIVVQISSLDYHVKGQQVYPRDIRTWEVIEFFNFGDKKTQAIGKYCQVVRK